MKYPRQAEFLRNARKNAGLTQREISDKLKLDGPQYISNVERGVAPLSPAHAHAVANILGVSRTDVLEVLVADIKLNVMKKAKRGSK